MTEPTTLNGVEVLRTAEATSLRNALLEVRVEHASGTYSVLLASGELVVKDATFGAKVGGKTFLAREGYDLAVGVAPVSDRLGDGALVEVWAENPRPSEEPERPTSWARLAVRAGEEHVTLEVHVKNVTGRDLELEEVYSCWAKAEAGGGVFVGRELASHRIVEGGLGMLFDFTVRVLNGGEDADSDWHVLFWDRESWEGEGRRRSLLFGAISPCGNPVQFQSSSDGQTGQGLVDSAGRRAFPSFVAVTRFLPRKKFKPGDVVVGETIAVDPVEGDPHRQLEKYADLVARFNGIRLTPQPVPAYWNSWNAPTGWSSAEDRDFGDAYGSMISEGVILENLEVMERWLKRFGMSWWGLDSGWATVGVWEPNERFPHGMKWLADQIHAKGLKAGIWLNPFNVDVRSEFYRAHPDWFVEMAPGFPVGDKNWRTLDLTRPDVEAWLRQLVRKVTREWGFDGLKCDFCYYVAGGHQFFDERATGTEVLRRGFQIIREEAGPETFVVACGGPVGFYWGLVDATRVGLDNMPRWGKDGEFVVEEQGLKPAVRVAAGRYYLQDRVWINHNDLIFFRPPLKFHEALSWATLYALTGSVFKIGDKLVQTKPEAFRVMRRLLPVYRKGARPVDLLYNQYPQVWDLHVDVDWRGRPLPPGLEPWHVVGLFNWGENVHLGERWDEERREVGFEGAQLGLEPGAEYLAFDFWEGRLAGRFPGSGGYLVELEPRTCQLLAVRPVSERPSFLSTNRHVTQGATDVRLVAWDEAAGQLSVDVDSVEGFEHVLQFHVPPGHRLDRALAGGTPARVAVDERAQLAAVTFPGNGARVTLELTFAGG
ncbi:MAG: hypothetical protein Kow0069_08530 [Promethearchaeota archaeon]